MLNAKDKLNHGMVDNQMKILFIILLEVFM